MFGWLKKEKDNFLLVKNITIDKVHSGAQEGTLYFYLYESKSGKRKIEYKITIQASDNFAGIAYYSETIYPWLQGKDFKDIPSYWDVVKERRADDIKRMYNRYFRI